MNKKRRGFTLIELLVVIAIIGVLSSVVLVSLNIARGKGANATIKSDLNSVRSQAELFYDSSPTGYLGVCADPQIQKAIIGSNTVSGGTAICNNSATYWLVSSPLKVPEDTSNYWCVDNAGVARGHASAITVLDVSCP